MNTTKASAAPASPSSSCTIEELVAHYTPQFADTRLTVTLCEVPTKLNHHICANARRRDNFYFIFLGGSPTAFTDPNINTYFAKNLQETTQILDYILKNLDTFTSYTRGEDDPLDDESTILF